MTEYWTTTIVGLLPSFAAFRRDIRGGRVE